MIEEIAIQDFQKWTRRVVKCDAPVTVLYGPSEAGKSSILRAAEWVATNRPTGEEMVGQWGGAAYAHAALVAEGRRVARRRGSGVNAYRVGDGPILSGFGTDVPQSVMDVLNLGEVNFQGQHEGPFWFMLPGPEVSRRLNAIINLTEIDSALTNAAGGVRSVNARTMVATERLATAVADRDALAWVPEATAAVERMERMAAGRATAAERADKLADVARTLRGAEVFLHNAAAAAQQLASAQKLAERILVLDRRAGDLRDMALALRRADPGRAAPIPDVSSIEKILKQRDAAAHRAHGLENTWMWLSSAEATITECTKEIKCLEKELSATSQLCPTCGQPIVTKSPPSRAATSTSERADHLRVAIKTGSQP